MHVRHIFIFVFLISILPHLDKFSAQAAIESNPKEIFDTSKQQSRTKKTKMTYSDDVKKTQKKCETLKNGKIFCTEKQAGKKSEILNPERSQR